MDNRRKFLKQMGIGGMGVAAMTYLPSFKSIDGLELAPTPFSPESQGVSSQGIIDFFNAAEKSGLEFHSIMINRNGKNLLEAWWHPFQKEDIHTMYSLSKSFTSTAVGMLVDQGKLSVDDKVISFFPNQLPKKQSKNLKAMRVYDLLTMHTGHTASTMGGIRAANDDDWVKTWLSLDVTKEPGSHFMYNTGATYMLSAIVTMLTGENLIQFLTPRLFEPLGIEGADWEECPKGINTGGYGLRIRTQDILNLGQLYLQKGEWNGKQILSSSWVADATKKQVDSQDNDSDWGQGYGYQFWRCKPGFYRGDGAYGQYCIVIPEKDAVIAITSETKDMGASMQLVWDYLLPAMKDAPINESWNTTKELKQSIAALQLPVSSVSHPYTSENTIDGKSYVFDANTAHAEKIGFSFKDAICTLSFQENGKNTTIKSGLNNWLTADNKKGANSLFTIPGRTHMPSKVSSTYFWVNQNTIQVKLKYIECMHHDVFTFKFSNDELTLDFDNSLSFQNKDERPSIHGKRN